jgi:hypothetical protein
MGGLVCDCKGLRLSGLRGKANWLVTYPGFSSLELRREMIKGRLSRFFSESKTWRKLL